MSGWSALAVAAADSRDSFVTAGGIRFVRMRAGCFAMGNALATDPAALPQSPVFTHGGEDERPVHRVRLTCDFYIPETGITAEQFTRLQEAHEDASHFSPFATGVSWEDAEGYAWWLSRQEARTYPAPHLELNAAWILDAAAGRPAGVADAPTERTRELHPDGSLKAEWGMRAEASGRMLLEGLEPHRYPGGAKEYEVSWENGAKRGLESHWDPQGRLVWQWGRRVDDTAVWTQIHTGGTKRLESTGRGNRCEGPAREWDRDGRMLR
ncbi:MAG TPA: SUMF1/EgtB/PvdO family nonheme iron enzyme [Lacunisphaera sp.]